jgi:hypothetical protein
MSTALAIMAHGGAQATVDDFLPHWKSLDAFLICSLPKGENLTGFDNYFHGGQSAYSGYHVFHRFMLTLRMLLETTYDDIIIAEYDTVNLRPELPVIEFGSLGSYFVVAEGPVSGSPLQLCALSPWCMDRGTGWKLLAACEESLTLDPDYEAGKGLLDRWIGKVVWDHGIPHHVGQFLLGYPWHVGVHDRIRNLHANWIHGWKTKEDFKHLWT